MRERHDDPTTLAPRRHSGGERGPRATATPKAFVDAAFEREELTALYRITWARVALVAAIVLWISTNYGPMDAWDSVLLTSLFGVVGLVQYRLTARHRDWRWIPYLFVVLDWALLALILLAPGRTYPAEWPWPMVLRLTNFLYFFPFIALAALTYSPGAMLWAGVAACLTWSAGTLVILGQPGSITGTWRTGATGETDAALLDLYLNPRFIDFDAWAVTVFTTLLVSGILSLAVRRSRQLVYEQAAAARARTNLARYVGPRLADTLAEADEPMGAVRRQDVAVLFADIRGFTALAERRSPEEIIGLLRAFHGRMAEVVFAHGGTLDKFIGDGLMATFGTPTPGPSDVSNALACAQAMLRDLDGWNAERRARGEAPIGVGIGLHHGPAVLGDIGGAERFEFAVIGDTVNVASRLERLTRELGCRLVVGDALIRRLRAEGAAPDLAAGLVHLEPRALRGRSGRTGVWVLKEG
jgi:adenylate cyclase